MHLRQHERASENERKKAEDDDEQRRLKLELIKGSSRASGSVADEIECVGLRRNCIGQNQWLNSLSLDSNYLQTMLSTLKRMSYRTELTNNSAPARKLPRCSNRAKDISQRN